VTDDQQTLSHQAKEQTMTYPQQAPYGQQPQQYQQPYPPQAFAPPQQFQQGGFPQPQPGAPGQFGQPAAPLPQFPSAPAPTNPDDFLAGGGKSINFGSLNSGGFKRMNIPFGGRVVAKPSISQVTNFTTKLPEQWPDGRPKEQMTVVLDTSAGPYPERDPADPSDNGHRTLFVKGSMVNPFRSAVQAGKAVPKLEPGDWVFGMHTGTKPGKGGTSYTWWWKVVPRDQQLPGDLPAPVALPPQNAQAAPQQYSQQPQGQPYAPTGYAATPAPAPQAYAPPQPQQYAPPVAQPMAQQMPDPDMAAQFAAWQAQQAQQPPAPASAPGAPGQAAPGGIPQGGAAGNPFA
jgi:hypothetical protein